MLSKKIHCPSCEREMTLYIDGDDGFHYFRSVNCQFCLLSIEIEVETTVSIHHTYPPKKEISQ